MPNPEAPTDTLDIEVIRPLSWVKELGAAPGGMIEFVLPEMGLWGDATVVRVADCPTIESGPGQVVLATVTHRNDRVYEIRFDAHAEPLYPTARHRLFSVDRGTWMRTDELREGERLLTADGCVSVLSTCRYPGAHRVYNIEVQTEHSYFVGFTRLLSHNVNPCGQAAESVHGNAKASTKSQHRYNIVDQDLDDVVKTGVSGGARNKNGTSPRANRQVNKLNSGEGRGRYRADVVETNVPGRARVLERERAATKQLKKDGNSLRLQKRPKP